MKVGKRSGDGEMGRDSRYMEERKKGISEGLHE